MRCTHETDALAYPHLAPRTRCNEDHQIIETHWIGSLHVPFYLRTWPAVLKCVLALGLYDVYKQFITIYLAIHSTVTDTTYLRWLTIPMQAMPCWRVSINAQGCGLHQPTYRELPSGVSLSGNMFWESIYPSQCYNIWIEQTKINELQPLPRYNKNCPCKARALYLFMKQEWCDSLLLIKTFCSAHKYDLCLYIYISIWKN